jgi:hypothetical protein
LFAIIFYLLPPIYEDSIIRPISKGKSVEMFLMEHVQTKRRFAAKKMNVAKKK